MLGKSDGIPKKRFVIFALVGISSGCQDICMQYRSHKMMISNKKLLPIHIFSLNISQNWSLKFQLSTFGFAYMVLGFAVGWNM